MTILFGLRDILGAVDRQIATLAASIEHTRRQREIASGLFPFTNQDQHALELRENHLVLLHAVRWLLDNHHQEPPNVP